MLHTVDKSVSEMSSVCRMHTKVLQREIIVRRKKEYKEYFVY